MFDGQYLGVQDKNGKSLHCGDRVTFKYFDPESKTWEDITATIIYLPELACFVLQWDTHKNYINRYFLNPERYEKIE